MRWDGNRESDNVEDRRGGGGGGGGFGFGGGSLSIGGVVIALILSFVFGINPLTLLGGMQGGAPQQATQQTTPANDTETRFMRTVLADTEDTWGALFSAQGAQYQPPKLVLFTGRTATGCGTGQSATGPFYCPADSKVYIDLDFYRLMKERFKVSGEFAQAYVVAHEIGHHVQHLLGVSDQVHQAQQTTSETQANALSVRLELQADCYAGVWAFHANRSRQILEQGDVEAALSAATAIGDDALQRQSQGHVVPDSFTHGTSAQRARWFRTGLDSGDVAQCDTFKARQL
ncbi:metalloprotease [Massilia dura]|uniref:Metalloprotease n=1 Tax=Pseudoduganella dura TaxID=321982 RepID=A0A6I3XDS9_9BURK|nr:neutral zinc metallopeptidase [Pseudoduganella dura]MUI12690.1 metalloprotease [Pseudoduganella dura]GGX96551.1 membrane protein [Pseudoduganella dura]